LGIGILFFEFVPRHFVGTAKPNLLGVLFGLFWISFPFYLEWVTRRCYKQQRNSNDECMIEFMKEMIHTEGRHSKSDVEWGAIQSSSEDDKTFLLYLTPARFLAVPKRACTDEQINELRTLLQDNVKCNSVVA